MGLCQYFQKYSAQYTIGEILAKDVYDGAHKMFHASLQGDLNTMTGTPGVDS
jgi:hypothetical protein